MPDADVAHTKSTGLMSTHREGKRRVDFVTLVLERGCAADGDVVLAELRPNLGQRQGSCGHKKHEACIISRSAR